MDGLRVLITNITLALRTGTETYVRDLALGLLRRGHTPIVYSTHLGQVADEIRAASVTVVDDLRGLAVAPDVIHGHHHPETMTALMHFPGVPALFVCHDRLSWHDLAPRFPRIRRYVAVDFTCRERLVLEEGVPEEQVRVIHNAVDLERFRPRGPLPPRPKRALVFSHNAAEHTHVPAVREACRRAGVELDVIGQGLGRPCARPETVLGEYDLVFAKARCALESLACGAAVVLCDSQGSGPLVTVAEFDRLRRFNLGMRTLRHSLDADVLAREIARFDAADATEVCRRVRAEAGLEKTLGVLEDLYREVIAEQEKAGSPTAEEEMRAAAVYLRRSAPLKEMLALDQALRTQHTAYAALSRDRAAAGAAYEILHAEYERVTAAYEALARERAEERSRLEASCEQLRGELTALRCSAAVRLRNRLMRVPLLGRCLKALRRLPAE